VGEDYAGELTADLGGDTDEYTVNVPRTGLTVDGGPGHDSLDSECRGCDAAEFDLATGAIRVDGADAGTALGFGSLYVENRRLPEITVVGTERPDSIIVHACHGELVGGARNDLLVVHGANPGACAAPSAALWGGGGDDTLDGTRGDDVIVGGTGFDHAYGDEGVDSCEAERRRDCEN
jgi:Ca2+-binding RTX toxin-like protein